MQKIHATHLIDATGSLIKDGVVEVTDNGTITGIEPLNIEHENIEHYEGLLCPGFINAHCHLELSYLKGSIPKHNGLVNFIKQILTIRNDNNDHAGEAMHEAEKEMWNEGIVGVGDISNAHLSFDIKARSRLRYHTFVECFGLDPKKTEGYFQNSTDVLQEAQERKLAASITPHAPYSMSDELFQRIFSFTKNEPGIFSYHNQESEQENKFFSGEQSDFDAFYQSFDLPAPARRSSSSLRAHLPLFPKNKKLLLVHNTFTSKEDVEWAMKEHPNLYFCFCPTANLYIENTLPPFEDFLPFKNRLSIGTDSLASNDSLSILKEMKIIQQKNPSIPTAELIRWATRNAADFFGWSDLGSIEIGKKPGLNLITGLDGNLKFSEKSAVKKLL